MDKSEDEDDDWFQTDDPDDRQSLDATFRSRSFRMSNQITNLALRILLLEFGDGQETGKCETLPNGKARRRNFIQSVWPLNGQKLGGSSLSWLSLIGIAIPLVYLTIAGLFSVHLAFIAIIHFQHDRLIEQQQSIRKTTQANRTEENRLQIEHLRDLMDRAGDPVASLAAVAPFLLGLIALMPLIFNPSTIHFMGLDNVRADMLSFLRDPLAERLRIRCEQVKIASEITESFRTYLAKRRLSSKRIGGADIIHYTRELISLNPVEPANLTSKWHRFIANGSIQSSLLLVVVYCLAVINLSGCIIAELSARASHRLGLIGPRSLMPELVESVRIEPLQLPEEEQAYRQFDNSTLGLLKLALTVELRYYLTGRVVLVLIEIALLLLVTVYVAIFFFTTSLLSSSDRIVWLNQIQAQLDDCIEQFNQNFYSANYRIRLMSTTKCEKIFIDLTRAYVNMQLFYRQQKHFKTFSYICTSVISGFIVSIMLLSYLIGVSFPSKIQTNFLLFLSTWGMLGANAMIFMNAYITKRLEKIMAKTTYLMAFHGSGFVPIDYLIELLQRQALDKGEIMQMYAPSILGIYSSYSNLVLLDSYLVGLWLILLQ